MEEVPRRTSLASLRLPCFILSLKCLETEGFVAFQGRAGNTSIVRWNLRPVIFRVETWIAQSWQSQLLASASIWDCVEHSLQNPTGDPSIKKSLLT